jgi:RNA polymerase sigma-70 factor (ECF subfamily)
MASIRREGWYGCRLEPVGVSAGYALKSQATRPEVLRRAGRGDSDALTQLYHQHAEEVYEVAFHLTESAADAQDIVQEVFVGLPEALRTYAGLGSFDSWLRTVTVRTALVKLRQRRRLREISLGFSRTALSLAPAGHIDRIELERALTALPEKLRIVVVLKEIQGFSHKEIAGLLGIRPSASAARLSRARHQLREHLNP